MAGREAGICLWFGWRLMASVRGTAARMPPLIVIYRVLPTSTSGMQRTQPRWRGKGEAENLGTGPGGGPACSQGRHSSQDSDPKREIISLVAERKLHVHLTGRQFPVTKLKGNLSSRDLYKRYCTQGELWVCKKNSKKQNPETFFNCAFLLSSPHKR